MTPRARPAAVLWDMDGTLVDTEPYWIEREHEIVAEYGNGQWSEEHGHALVGQDLRDSARYIIEHGGLDLDVDTVVNLLLDGVIERVRRRIPWRPGARELLAALTRDGVPCALVTMSWRRFVEPILEALPPGSFQAIVTGDEVTNGKPHPEAYQRAAALLGVKPTDCVAIEDSPTGVRSAVAAGCQTIAVPHVIDIPNDPAYRVERSLVGLTPTRLLPRPQSDRRRIGLLAAAAIVVVGVAAGATVVLDRDDRPPPPDIPIDAWAPYWKLDRNLTALDRYGYILREVSPFWFETRGATEIVVTANVPADAAERFIAEARDQDIAVLPAIVDGTDTGVLAGILADPASRTAHVQALVDFAAFGDFDGVDLDYEGFAFVDDRSTWDATRPNWVAFITELGAALRADGRQLVVTVPPPQTYTVYAIDQIEPHVDRIRVMAYDYSTAEPGPIAPLFFVQDTVDAAKSLVSDDNKVVLGVPLYGYNWVVATTGTCPADAPGQREAVAQHQVDELVQRRGAVPQFNAETGESSFTYDLELSDGATTCVQTRQVHYVDAEGARRRIDLARRARLGGASLWALGFDDEATWLAISSLGRIDGDGATTTPTTAAG